MITIKTIQTAAVICASCGGAAITANQVYVENFNISPMKQLGNAMMDKITLSDVIHNIKNPSACTPEFLEKQLEIRRPQKETSRLH
jgi:hypothetical protein